MRLNKSLALVGIVSLMLGGIAIPARADSYYPNNNSYTQQRIQAERQAEQRRIEAQRQAEQRRIEAQRQAEQRRIEAQRQAANRY